MNFIKVVFTEHNDEIRDVLIALTSEMGFEGFEETENGLFAFIQESEFNKQSVAVIADDLKVQFSFEIIEERNWNELWESNFEPVLVDDFCAIRAHFHEPILSTKYELIITPKMSFGTGHHETTQMMIEMMRKCDFREKKVFDFGCGTGVLAILSDKLGAKEVVGIDIDHWAYENSVENALSNNCPNIKFSKGVISDVIACDFDIILANINKQILIENLLEMCNRMQDNSLLLMSGILKSDVDEMIDKAKAIGFVFIEQMLKGNWACVVFKKGNP